MASRSRVGPWILLALCAALVAAAWWIVRADRARALGTASQAPLDAPAAAAEPSTEPRGAPSEPAIVRAPGDAREERTSFLPPLADDGGAAALELDVRGVEGAPLANARVHVFDESESLGNASTDEHGVARVRASSGAGHALVVSEGAAPWLAEVELAPGRVRVDEPERPTLHGRLRVDRAEPAAEIELELTSDRALFDAASIPAALRAALDLDRRATTRLRTRCDPHGDFAFRGLDEPFAGRIDVPERYAIVRVEPPGVEAGRSEARLAAFVPELTLDLLALPTLVGRVVEADGTAVAHAQVEGWMGLAGDERTQRRMLGVGLDETRCDAEGRFEFVIALPRGLDAPSLASADAFPAVERGELSVRRNARANAVDVEFRGSAMADRWDVGDLVLPPAHALEVVVRGPDQKPIAGAVVIAGDAQATSDEGGSARLAHVEEVESASVGKLGYRPADVALDGAAAGAPLEVVLQPTNVWTVAFVDAAGAPIAERRFALVAVGALFLGDDPTRPSETHVESGSTRAERSFRDRDTREVVTYFRSDEHGRAVLCDLASPFTLRVTDGLGVALEERTIALAPDESRTDEVRLETRGGTFAGRVVDAFGVSLADARVRLFARELRSTAVEHTDAAGEFRFEDLQPGRVRLEIQRTGFSPLAIESYELPLEAGTVEFALSQAGTIAVEIVDDLGNAVAVSDLRVQAPQHPNLPVRRRGTNRFELRQLPGDLVTLRIGVGGRTFERDLDASGGDAQVVVPRHGRARVSYAPAKGEAGPLLVAGGTYRAIVRSLGPGEPASVTQTLRVDRQPIAASFDALLPGEYEVGIEWREARDRDGSSARSIGAPQRFSVTANSTARVEVRE